MDAHTMRSLITTIICEKYHYDWIDNTCNEITDMISNMTAEEFQNQVTLFGGVDAMIVHADYDEVGGDNYYNDATRVVLWNYISTVVLNNNWEDEVEAMDPNAIDDDEEVSTST